MREYDDFIYMVAHGADPDKKGTAEVHCFWTDRYVVTVHRGECPALTDAHDRLERPPPRGPPRRRSSSSTWSSSALVDSFFPFLSTFDDRIDALEDDILKTPTEAQLGAALRHEADAHGDA